MSEDPYKPSELQEPSPSPSSRWYSIKKYSVYVFALSVAALVVTIWIIKSGMASMVENDPVFLARKISVHLRILTVIGIIIVLSGITAYLATFRVASLNKKGRRAD